MQNLISNVKIWPTTNTPPAWAVNTFHAISSPSVKVSWELSSVICQEGGTPIPEKPPGVGTGICVSERGVDSKFP